MNKKHIQSIMQEALESEIPSEEIQLWPTVKSSLVAGKQPYFQQGEKMNPTKSHRIAWVAFATLVMLALLMATFLTPQGRAIAKDIVRFFTRADSNSFPLQPSQIAADEIEQAGPTAEPPSPLLSVAEAGVQAGFDAAELPAVPAGFNYLGARVYGDAISIEYEAQGSGGNLILMQSPDGFVQSEWDQVPAEVIIPVKIGELDGEFAQGTFVVYPGETSAKWNSEAPILRLRWERNGIWFEMMKIGDVEAIEYLDQAGMIMLAESLFTKP